MPWNFGLLGAVALRPPSGDYELIGTTILNSEQLSIDFINLNQYSSQYKHLQIRFSARTTRSQNGDFLNLRFNNQSSNYNSHTLYRSDPSVSSFSYSVIAAGTAAIVGEAAANQNTSNAFAGFVIDIIDPYSSTKNKTTKTFSGMATPLYQAVSLNSGLWMNTEPVSSISLSTYFGNSFISGSRFSIYGVRG